MARLHLFRKSVRSTRPESLARQVEDHALADAGHAVEERRDHGRGQHVDRAVRKALMDHTVAAHEIADLHKGHDQDRAAAGCRRLTPSGKTIVYFQNISPPAGISATPLIDRQWQRRRHARAPRSGQRAFLLDGRKFLASGVTD